MRQVLVEAIHNRTKEIIRYPTTSGAFLENLDTGPVDVVVDHDPAANLRRLADAYGDDL